MIYFTDSDIDRLIEDDAPLGDLTTRSLALERHQAAITWRARAGLVVCCTEELERLCQKVGLDVSHRMPSGTKVSQGESILAAQGRADAAHLAWRSGLALLEFASAIATRTQAMVRAAQAASPRVKVAGTRKHPPYLKKVALKALVAGGGVAHRTGLSDTVLLFREHLLFEDSPEAAIAGLRLECPERKIVCEAHDTDFALALARAGADAVQMDKMPAAELADCARQCRAINPRVLIVAAGGLRAENAASYAEAGADVLVSSWMYFGPPADIGVAFQRR